MTSTVQETCYVCMTDGSDEAFKEPSPCRCKGTIHIHESCLEEVKKTMQSCSICRAAYRDYGPDGLITIKRINRGMIEISKIDGDGKLQGPLKRFTSEEKVALDLPCFEVNYKDGLPDGPMKDYNIYMDILEGNAGSHWIYIRMLQSVDIFEMGKLNGNSYKYWMLPDEQISSITEDFRRQYEAGDIRDYHITINDPPIKKIIPFVDTKKNGTVIKYSIDGIQIQTIEYVNNEKHGLVKTYSPQGKVVRTEQYSVGFKEGDEISYDSDGQTVKMHRIYKGGAWIRNKK